MKSAIFPNFILAATLRTLRERVFAALSLDILRADKRLILAPVAILANRAPRLRKPNSSH